MKKQPGKKQLFGLGVGLGLFFSTIPAGFAVQPAPVGPNARIEWSRVVENPFDGKIVYDKHFTNDFAFVTSWSQSGIRATYTQYRSELVGYRTIWRTATYHDRYGRRCYRRYAEDEPIYRRYTIDSSPSALQLAINGQVFTYEGGAVSPELAAALASAPPTNMPIRIIWRDGRTQDMEIGRGTVNAWKIIYQDHMTGSSSR